MQSCLPKRGISTLEIIVIVGVIAVLVLLILPDMLFHRQTRGLKCYSNMRQLSLAIMMEAQDNKETLPAADEWATKSGVVVTSSFDCPSSVFRGTIKAPEYMYVAAFFHNQHGLLSRRKLSDIKDASQTIELVELRNPGKAGQTSYVSDAIEVRPGKYAYDPRVALYNKIARTRHKGSSRIAYVDGHVEYLRATEFAESMFLNSMTAHEPILKR